MPSSRSAESWERTLRYGRSRLFMRIELLPEDVLEQVCALLSHDDLTRFCEAMHWRSYGDVPSEARSRLVHEHAERKVLHTLQNRSSHAAGFVAAQTLRRVVVAADWSVFSARPPDVLAAYEWCVPDNGGIESFSLSMCVRADVLSSHVARLVRSECRETRLSFHIVGCDRTGRPTYQPECCHAIATV